MNITLKQLNVFCALYELRSFTEAARATDVTQSAVSKLCAELEAEVGQVLFERSTRTVTPSDGAAELYLYAQEILGAVRAAERSLSGYRTLENGSVGIAGSPLIMAALLPEVIASFYHAHPDVKLDLFELTTDETIERVRHGHVDFGIVSLKDPIDDLDTRIIFRDSLYAVCPLSHRFARNQSVSWKELATERQVMLHSANNVRRSLARVAADLGLEFDYVIEADTLLTILNLVRLNAGVTVIPGYACKLANQLGLYVLPMVGSRVNEHLLWLVERRQTRLSLAATAFLTAIESHLSTPGHVVIPKAFND